MCSIGVLLTVRYLKLLLALSISISLVDRCEPSVADNTISTRPLSPVSTYILANGNSCLPYNGPGIVLKSNVIACLPSTSGAASIRCPSAKNLGKS